jgi:ABC-type amino acid transport substrate-binding protein
VIDFPDPLVFNPGGLIVAPGNPHRLHRNADFNNGMRVAVAEGTLYSKVLELDAARGQKIQALIVPGFNECVNAVVSGQADAGLVDAVTAQFALKQNPGLGFELVGDFNPTDDKAWLTAMPTTVSDMAFAKSQPDLRAAWNKDFTALSKDGSIDAIFRKYGLTPGIYVASPEDPEYVKH